MSAVTGRPLTHPDAEWVRLADLGLDHDLVDVLAARAAQQRRWLTYRRPPSRHARHAA